MLKLTIIQQNLHQTNFDCLSDKVFKYLNVLVLTLTLKMFTFNQLSINLITLYIVSFIGINILNVMLSTLKKNFGNTILNYKILDFPELKHI